MKAMVINMVKVTNELFTNIEGNILTVNFLNERFIFRIPEEHCGDIEQELEAQINGIKCKTVVSFNYWYGAPSMA